MYQEMIKSRDKRRMSHFVAWVITHRLRRCWQLKKLQEQLKSDKALQLVFEKLKQWLGGGRLNIHLMAGPNTPKLPVSNIKPKCTKT